MKDNKKNEKWLLSIIKKGDNKCIQIGKLKFFSISKGKILPWNSWTYEEICDNTTKTFQKKYLENILAD